MIMNRLYFYTVHWS